MYLDDDEAGTVGISSTKVDRALVMGNVKALDGGVSEASQRGKAGENVKRLHFDLKMKVESQ